MMNAEKKSALVAGATGLVGRHCVELLLNHEAYAEVKILVRRPVEMRHPKLKVCLVDFDELENHGVDLIADDVFCALGTTIKKAGSQAAFRKVDFDYTVKIAALLQHADARQFLLVSSIGADPQSRIFYNQVKGDVEEAVRRIPFNAVQVFRPSLLLGKREEQRSSEQIGAVLMAAVDWGFVGSMRKWRAIEARSVARAMVAVAQNELPGFHVYPSDLIQKISDGAWF
jgi:uncharacterized protein YbjT (DUF2867 family)